jgi:phosphoribosylformylglycinamidine synthase
VLSAAHDVSDGGLAVALAELALHSGLGASVELDHDVLTWFGEGAGRAVVACPPERAESLEGVALRRLGVVGGDRILDVSLDDLREAHEAR